VGKKAAEMWKIPGRKGITEGERNVRFVKKMEIRNRGEADGGWNCTHGNE
jgi:hypothetical protein